MPEATINVGVAQTGTDVFSSIMSQINGVKNTAIGAMNSVLSNVSSMYAKRPRIPPAGREAVSTAIAAMRQLAAAPSASAQQIVAANETVKASLESLVLSYMSAERGITTQEAAIKAMPPNVRRMATAFMTVTDTLTQLGSSLNVIDRIRQTLAGLTGQAIEAGTTVAGAGEAAAIGAEGLGQVGAEAQIAQAGLSGVSQVGSRAGTVFRSMLGGALGFVVTHIKSLLMHLGLLKKAEEETSGPAKKASNALRSLGMGMERIKTRAKEAIKPTGAFHHNLFTTIKHSRSTTQALDVMSSAFQGIMLASSLANGQLIGIAMSFFFMRMSMLPLFALFAGITMAFYAVMKPLQALIKNLREAGKTAQTVIMQFKQLAGSLAGGVQMWKVSADWAIRYGYAIDDTRKAMVGLWQQGMLNEEVMKASIAISTAFSMTLDQASKVLSDAIGTTEGNTEALAEYGVAIDSTTDSLDRNARATAVANAVLDRYGQAVEDRVQTMAVASQRAGSAVQWFWEVFTEPVVSNVIAPVINSIANFIAMIAQFVGALWSSSDAQSYFNETLKMASDVVREYTPEIQLLANIVKFVVAGAFWFLQSALRAGVIAMQNFFKWIRNISAGLGFFGRLIKPVVDMLRQLAGGFKQITFSTLLQRVKDLVLNMPIILGLLGPKVIDVWNALKTVWTASGSQMIAETLAAIFSWSLWSKFAANPISGIKAGLLIGLIDLFGRVFIELLPTTDAQVKTALSHVLDWAVWGAIATPLIVTLGGLLLRALGVGLGTAILGWPSLVITGIGLAIGAIVGIIDEKFNLGIGDWIRNKIPKNAQDWNDLWQGIVDTFNNIVVPFFDQTVPQAFVKFGEWLTQTSGIELPTIEIPEIKIPNAQAILTFFKEFKLPEFKFPEIKLPDWITEIINKFGVLQGLWDSLGGTASLINNFTDALKPLQEWMSSVADLLGGAFSSSWSGIVQIISTAAQPVIGFFEGLAPVLSPIMELLGSIAQLFGALGIAIIKLWEAVFMPFIKWLAEKMTPIIKKVSDNVKKTAEVFRLGFKAAGDVIKIFGFIVGRILAAIVTFIGGVIETIIGLLVGGPEAAKAEWEDLVSDLQNILNSGVEWIKNKIGQFVTDFLAWWTYLKERGSEAVGELWSTITGWFQAIWDFLFGHSWVDDMLSSFLGFFGDVLSGFTEWLGEIWENITDKFSEIATAVSDKWTEIKESISDLIEEAKQAVKTKAEEIWTAITTKFNEIKSDVSDKWEEIKDSIQTAIEDARSSVVTKAGEIWTAITTKFAEIGTAVSTKWSEIKESISTLIEEARAAVATKAGEIWTVITTKFQEILAWFTDPIGILAGFISGGQLLMEKVIEGITGKVQSVVDAITGVISTVVDTVTTALGAGGSLFSKIVGVGKDLIAGFISGIKEKVGDLIAEATGAIQSVIDAIIGLLGLGHSPSEVTKEMGYESAEGFMIGFSALPAYVSSIMKDTVNILQHRMTEMQGMAANIGMSPYILAPIIAGMPIGQGGGGQSVTIVISNNDFGNLEPEEAGQTMADEIMRRLSLNGVILTRRY